MPSAICAVFGNHRRARIVHRKEVTSICKRRSPKDVASLRAESYKLLRSVTGCTSIREYANCVAMHPR
eukprot:3218846-Heterocapsa_arctica.AAC.1